MTLIILQEEKNIFLWIFARGMLTPGYLLERALIIVAAI